MSTDERMKLAEQLNEILVKPYEDRVYSQKLMLQIYYALRAPEAADAGAVATDEQVEVGWSAIVGSDIAPICFNASIIREDLRSALTAVLRTVQTSPTAAGIAAPPAVASADAVRALAEMSSRLRNLRIWSTRRQNYDPVPICIEAADLIDAALSAPVAGADAGMREGLEAAVRCANLALFVIRKQGVMPNSSWEAGFKRDLKMAEDALAALPLSPDATRS